MTKDHRFVQCKVSPGLFKSELFVSVEAGSSAYVSCDNVRVSSRLEGRGEVEGEVRAYLIEETEDKALVEFPGEPVVGGLRTWVPKSSLVTP